MNSNYNYSDFSGTSQPTDNEYQRYDEQLELQQVSIQTEVTENEKQIEELMLNKYSSHSYFK